MLKAQQRFKIYYCCNIILSLNEDKRNNQLIRQKQAYEPSKNLESEQGEVKCKNIIKQYKND